MTVKNENSAIKASLGGLLLFGAATLAMLIANSHYKTFYDSLLNSPIGLQISDSLNFKIPLIHWINDGLMTLFFLLVGLEIKREWLSGKLSDPSVAILPVTGALGGLIVPGLIYFTLNYSDPVAIKGWGIPVATDIAFSLAVLSLLGSAIPNTLKIFLTALAIIDDIAAVIIIALFYTNHLSPLSLAAAGITILGLVVMNKAGIERLSLYALVGLVLWFSVFKSGVHATLSGIVLAFTIPLHSKLEQQYSPLERLESYLVPIVTLFVLPLFAFANSGFSLSGITREIIFHTTTLGIILGLVIGKQVGVFSSCYFFIKMRWAKLPENVNWRLLYGISLLCGIGFTMSLFIGSLAFQHQSDFYSPMVRFSVLTGSLVSALLGAFVISSQRLINEK